MHHLQDLIDVVGPPDTHIGTEEEEPSTADDEADGVEETAEGDTAGENRNVAQDEDMDDPLRPGTREILKTHIYGSVTRVLTAIFISLYLSLIGVAYLV